MVVRWPPPFSPSFSQSPGLAQPCRTSFSSQPRTLLPSRTSLLSSPSVYPIARLLRRPYCRCSPLLDPSPPDGLLPTFALFSSLSPTLAPPFADVGSADATTTLQHQPLLPIFHCDRSPTSRQPSPARIPTRGPALCDRNIITTRLYLSSIIIGHARRVSGLSLKEIVFAPVSTSFVL